MVATCPSRSYRTVSLTTVTLNNAGGRRIELLAAAGACVGRRRDVRPWLAAREGAAVRAGDGELAGEPRAAQRPATGPAPHLERGGRRARSGVGPADAGGLRGRGLADARRLRYQPPRQGLLHHRPS